MLDLVLEGFLVRGWVYHVTIFVIAFFQEAAGSVIDVIRRLIVADFVSFDI